MKRTALILVVFAVSLLLFLAFPSSVSAWGSGQVTVEEVLQAQYQTLILTLRHPFQQPSQQYDLEGNPVGGGPEGTEAANGRVLIDQIRGEKHHLLITGRRINLPEGRHSMPVPGESLQIEIALKDHATLEQVQAALGRVFLLNRDGEPQDSLSKSWLCEAGSSNCDAIEQIGPGVTAPRLVYSPEPDFSERARKAKYQGTLVMNIVLNKAGRVLRTRVTRQLGMDLDEQAIGKISTWKFNPATRNGQPVVVALSVEVSFNLN